MNYVQQLKRGGEWGLLIIVALMPFHAFASVYLGSLIGHQSLIQAWKDVLIALLALVTIIVIWRDPARRRRLKQPIFYLVAAFIGVALVVSALGRPTLHNFIFGAKTDLEMLVALVCAWVLAGPATRKYLKPIIFISSGIVIAFGLLLAWVLPPDFLLHFGYGPTTIQPVLGINQSLQANRILSTLGGPNQLGSFLLLPLGLALAEFVRHPRWWLAAYFIAGLGCLGTTFSRSAWIGAVIGLALVLVISVPRRLTVWVAAGLLVVLIGGGIGLNAYIRHSPIAQYYLLRGTIGHSTDATSSDGIRLAAQKHGWAEFRGHPLGEGLGTAGPASQNGPKPLITENYYLQIGIETGIFGLILFLGICATIGRSLLEKRQSTLAVALFGSLIGISIINLFLHGWADSSTALVWWTATGFILGSNL